MFVDTLPSEKTVPDRPPTRMTGRAAVTFGKRDGATRLRHLEQRAPLRVLFPRPARDDLPIAALVTTSGGLVGGDRMEIELAVEPEARAIAVAQAAEKVYRSTGADAGVDISLSVDDAGWLEWLPQETILFDGARLVRRTRIDVVPTGRLLAGECLVFGRVARGEQFRRGRLRESWEVRRSSRLVWADRFHLEDDIDRVLATPAGLAGARAYATAIYVSPDAADFLEPARGWAAHDGVRAGVTCIDRVLITRWLGWDAALVRGAFETFWSEIRCAAGGLPKCLPRLWHI